MSREKPVKWPGRAYSADAEDLGEPLQQLLQDLHVLEREGDEHDLGPFRGTPYSVQVITAGATALGKGWTAVVGFLGGGGALAAGLQGLGYASEEPLLAATFTASAAVLLAAVAVSIAVMVRADVSARATASAAQYRARADISSALLSSGNYNRPAPAVPSAPASRYMARVGDRWFPVKEFRQGVNGVVADLVGASEVEVSKLAGVTSTDAWEGK